MHQPGKLVLSDVAKPALPRQFDEWLALRGPFGHLGTRTGIQQRQFCNTAGRQAHDLKRDIASHRQAGERETRRRGSQYSPRDRRHTVVAAVIGDRDRAELPKHGNLLGIKACRAIQSWNEDDRQRFCRQIGHENSSIVKK